MFNGINQSSNPAVPSGQQVVIPQITIPNNFQPFVSNNTHSSIQQITVKGKEAGKNYKLPPNSRAAIFDEDEPIFYYKETDDTGNEIAFKTCRYEEIEDPPEPEYLTVQEFRSAISELEKRLKEGLANEQPICNQTGKHQANE